MTACNAVLKSELKSETSFKLCSNIISGATAGLVYARNGPLQQVLVVCAGKVRRIKKGVSREFIICWYI